MDAIPINFSNQPVGTSLAVVGKSLVLNGRHQDISLAILNTGGAALTHWQIQVAFIDGGAWVPLLSDSDFATTDSTLLAVSGGNSGYAPQALPAGQTAWLRLDPGAVAAIQFLAAASAPTTLSLQGGARLRI